MSVARFISEALELSRCYTRHLTFIPDLWIRCRTAPHLFGIAADETLRDVSKWQARTPVTR